MDATEGNTLGTEVTMDFASWHFSTAVAHNVGAALAFGAVKFMPLVDDVLRELPARECSFRSTAAALRRRDLVPSRRPSAHSRAASERTSAAATRAAYEPTQAEAAALADAGMMPLADYLELASRKGWSSEKL
jgi:hypothetical protein